MDLVSEIGMFSAYLNGEPVTQFNGYAGYVIRSKPVSENEGGINSGERNFGFSDYSGLKSVTCILHYFAFPVLSNYV